MEHNQICNNATEAICMKLEYDETHEATNGNLPSDCEKSSDSINENHSKEAITKTPQLVQVLESSTTHANNPITRSSSESSLTEATSSESETSIDSEADRETPPVSKKRKTYAQKYLEQFQALQEAKLENLKQYFQRREEMLELRFKQKEEIKEKRHQEKMKKLNEILQKMRD